jgi:Alpha-L-arabinofuranosidase B, catalytic
MRRTSQLLLKQKISVQTLFAVIFISFCTACSGNSNTGSTTGNTTGSSTARPCDLFASTTPCVAAFSTTRALYASYTGPLYQVTRASGNATLDIGLLSDGYANAAAQDSFCANTTCTITEIYDQSSNHNNLTVAPPGGADQGAGPQGYDLPAIANALPATVAGHEVYGIYISPGMGYRNDATTGIAVNGEPEGVYMVSSTYNINSGCCFDFGNAEVNNKDNGAGHMDAINLHCPSTPCAAIAGLDMENGIYGKLAVPAGLQFVTVMGANDGQKSYNIWQGNAQSGGLTAKGPTALPSGYSPMKQEGAIILGIGGDNSNKSSGYFFEGAMTQGVPTSTAMSNVQSNIVSTGYAGL